MSELLGEEVIEPQKPTEFFSQMLFVEEKIGVGYTFQGELEVQ